MRDYLDAIHSRVVLFDGGMGATLEQFDLTQEDYGGLQGKCHEALVLNRPDVIAGVHESMIEAGAEVVETDTFQASRLKLDEWGLGEHTLEINTKAAQIAREAVGEERFVAGSIGPTGMLPASDDPTLGNIRFQELVDIFTEQATGLVNGGADRAKGRDGGHGKDHGDVARVVTADALQCREHQSCGDGQSREELHVAASRLGREGAKRAVSA